MLPAPVIEASWRLAHVREQWPQVRVDVAEIAADGTSCHIRSVVHLGALCPVDVHVELVSAAGVAYPLWTSRAYDNGCFVYERTLAPVALAAHDTWAVRVRAAVATLGHAAHALAPVARTATMRGVPSLGPPARPEAVADR